MLGHTKFFEEKMALVNLGLLSDFTPGTLTLIKKECAEFLVICTSSKSYLVIPPSCPHMNASLCDGFFDGEVLTCEKHLWQWNGSSGTAMGIAELPLDIYESTLKDGCLHVNFLKELKYAYLD
jgi:toluene monooxygenase system ferredoxin subunit